MKAISVRQPWAWMIIHAGKDIENRDWPTRFRGTILIHASKGMTRLEYDEASDFYKAIRRDGYPIHFPPIPNFESLERGGIIGQANIIDCVSKSDSRWFFGEFGFVLSNSKPLPFREYKGQLSIFDISFQDVFSQIEPQTKEP